MIIMVAPPYWNASGGIRVQYELIKRINEFTPARIVLYMHADALAAIGSTPKEYQDLFATFDEMMEGLSEGCVIYPEVVSGNPFGAKRVIRYILNVPGLLGGTKEYALDEIKVAYNEALGKYADGEILTTPIIEPYFRNEGLQRSGALVWIGKGINDFMIKGATEITRYYPRDRKQLARLLNEAEILYTYDDFTMLTDEALLCGCKVILRKDGKETEIKEAKNFEQMKRFPEQLERLIGRLA